MWSATAKLNKLRQLINQPNRLAPHRVRLVGAFCVQADNLTQKGAMTITNPMQGRKTYKGEQAQPIDTFAFEKTIGATNYKVCVHFNQKSDKTYEDKILRLIESAVNNRG